MLSGVPVTSGSAEEYLVAGGIVGEAATWQPQKGAPNASTISKCSTYGNIEIISDRIIAVTGGIAGVVATYSSDSTHSLLLENCYSACNLNVKTDVAGTVMGGIIGGADRGIKELSVINCASNCKYTWSTGKVEGLEADYIGGIAGMMGETPNVKVAKCRYIGYQCPAVRCPSYALYPRRGCCFCENCRGEAYLLHAYRPPYILRRCNVEVATEHGTRLRWASPDNIKKGT